MIRKIIILDCSYFRSAFDWGKSILNHLDIDVEFWSYVQWKYPDSFRSFVPRDVRPDSEVRYIPDRYAFLEALDTLRLKNTMFILVNTTSGAVEKCLSETIVRKGGMYSYVLLYALPPSRHMMGNSLLKKLLVPFRNLFSILKYRNLLRYPPCYCFLPTMAARNNLPRALRFSKTSFVEIHAMDYDTLYRRNNFPMEEKHIVFIESVSNVEDLKKIGQDGCDWCGPFETYYQSINTLFAALEKLYGKPVVIAAHPAAKLNGDEFNGRKILFGMTDLLVKQAALVVTHQSAAISFPVIYGKPILACCNDFMRKHFLWDSVPYFDLLGLSYFNLSNPDWEHLPQYICCDSDQYRFFMENYIKRPGTVNLPYFEAIGSVLKNKKERVS